MADLKGNVVAKEIKEDIKKQVNILKDKNIVPTMAIVRMGSNPNDLSYEKSILKNCEKVGIASKVYEMDIDTSIEKLLELIDDLNKDENIHGILIFRPLPKHIDEDIIKNAIDPKKDIDCMNPYNLEKIFEGDVSGVAPCTAKAAIKILEYYGIPLEGANVTIINRSMVVGRPLAMMLLGKNATVTICHSKTKNLKDITYNSDIVVTALGKAKFFGSDYFNENATVIDVGVSLDKDGKLSGDVDYGEVSKKVKYITPVPGGVGSITTSILLSHILLFIK